MWWRLKRRIHSSWLIAMLCFFVVVGDFLSQFFGGSMFAPSIWLIVVVICGGIGFWKRTVTTASLIIVAGLLLGLWRGSTGQVALTIYEPLAGKVITVMGTVSEDPSINTSGQPTIALGGIVIGTHHLPGKLLVTSASNAVVKRGDVITVQGQLDEPFGSYAGTMYQARVVNIVEPYPGDMARRVRDWFAALVHRAIPEPGASLGLGYLVGQKSALPSDLIQALQIAGLTHVVVASGYNLTILVRLSRRLFARFSKYLAAMMTGLLIASFMAITGLSPSMSRAGLVAGLSLLAWYYGRSFHPIVLLCFAAGVTVLINPSYAWSDLGWALSFTSFGGVMLVAPLLQRYFFGTKEPGTIRQILGETIAAHVVTAPLIVYAFGQLSNVAIISNLLVLPFVPIAMLLTFAAGIGALVLPSLAMLIGLPASWLLGYMVNITKYLAGLSWAQTIVYIGPLVTGLCYIVLIAICVWLWRVTKLNFRATNIVE